MISSKGGRLADDEGDRNARVRNDLTSVDWLSFGVQRSEEHANAMSHRQGDRERMNHSYLKTHANEDGERKGYGCLPFGEAGLGVLIHRVRVNRDNIRYAERVSSGEIVKGKTSEWVSPATDRVVRYKEQMQEANEVLMRDSGTESKGTITFDVWG